MRGRPDISAGKERMLALLFDMNVLWEEYVLVSLRKHLRDHPELNYNVKGQDSKKFWQDKETGYWRYVKPDIVLTDLANEKTYVIDTKWKRPPNQKAAIEDIRQMYAYNHLYKSNRSLLLYPGEKQVKSGEYFDDVNGDKHECLIGFVSVLKGDVLSDKVGEDVFEMVVEYKVIIQ